MNSADLTGYGFGTWLSFSGRAEARLLAQLPRSPGVFAFRRQQPYPRQTGASDLVYIGVGANQQGGLQNRIRQVFHPGPS